MAPPTVAITTIEIAFGTFGVIMLPSTGQALSIQSRCKSRAVTNFTIAAGLSRYVSNADLFNYSQKRRLGWRAANISMICGIGGHADSEWNSRPGR